MKHSVKKLKSLIPFLVSNRNVIILFNTFDLGQTIEILKTSNFKLVILASMVAIFAKVLIGTIKWKRILAVTDCKLKFNEVLMVRTGCMPLKLIFPMKSSEIFKAVYFKKSYQLPITSGVSTLIFEKVINLLVMTVILLIGIVFIKHDKQWVTLVISCFALLAVIMTRAGRKIIISLAGFVHPAASDFISKILGSFEGIGNREMLFQLFYSSVYLVSDFLSPYLLFKAVGAPVPFTALIIFIPLTTTLNYLPISIMGLGTREAMLIYFFADFGTGTQLLSGGLLVSMCEQILPVVVGFYFLRPFLKGVFNENN